MHDVDVKMVRGQVTDLTVTLLDENDAVIPYNGSGRLSILRDDLPDNVATIDSDVEFANGVGTFAVTIAADVPTGRYLADVTTDLGNTERFYADVVAPIATGV